MSKKLKCHLKIHNSNSNHLNQIYAGFIELEHKGIITLSKEIINDSSYSYLEVIINDNYILIYDTQDSGNIFVPEIDWDKVDCYFKRSYDKDICKNISLKIRPLGLNYDVHSKYGNFQSKKYNIKNMIKKLLGKQKEIFYLEDFEQEEIIDNNSKICFLTRVYDPNSDEVENDVVREERKAINGFRIECINACKNKYGDKFFGGIQNSEFARRNFPEFIIEDSSITQRENYLEFIKNVDICIATTGLHNSIGWKLVEYVCLGKAIVSEKLHYSTTGDFSNGKNYLEFSSTDELLNQIDKLINNKNAMNSMKKSNLNYYKKYLRADQLIFNTIKTYEET